MIALAGLVLGSGAVDPTILMATVLNPSTTANVATSASAHVQSLLLTFIPTPYSEAAATLPINT